MNGETGRGHGSDTARVATTAPDVAQTTPTVDRKLAPATSRAYAADWHHFVEWCRGAGHASLPATATTLATYLTALAPTLSRGALNRRVAAIAHAHRARSLPPPDADPAARRALRAVKRQAAPGPHRPPPPSGPRLARMAGACPSRKNA